MPAAQLEHQRRRRSRPGRAPAVPLPLLLACMLDGAAGLGNPYETTADPMHSVEVFWDFEDGVQGWGNKTSEEMMCEVTHRGGEIRGVVRELSTPEATDAAGNLLDAGVDRTATDTFGRPIHGLGKHYSEPHIDSPPLKINAVDRHFIIIRMKYSGLAQSGRVVLRPGEEMPKRAFSGPGAVKFGASGDPDAFTESFRRGDWVWAEWQQKEWRLATVLEYYQKEGTYDVEYHYNSGTNPNFAAEKCAKYATAATQASANYEAYGFADCPREYRVPKVHVRDTKLNRTAFVDDGEVVRPWSNELPDFSTTGGNLANEDLGVPPQQGVPRYDSHGKHMPLMKIDFEVIGDGQWREIYVPVWKYYFGNFTQIRLYPALSTSGGIQGPVFGDTFAVDWIKIAKAPTIKRVTGCFDKFYATSHLGYGVSNITRTEHLINNHLYHYSTNHFALTEAPFLDRDKAAYTAEGGSALAYASTYHCQREGGQTLTLTGTNFGNVHDLRVQVGGRPCESVRMTRPETQVECIVPPAPPLPVAPSRSASWREDGGRVSDNAGHGQYHDHAHEGEPTPRQYTEREVRGQHAFGEGRLHESYPMRERRHLQQLPVLIVNGQLPKLRDEVPYFSYAVRPPRPLAPPTLSNLAAHSMDLSWPLLMPADVWDAITVTGWLIEARTAGRDGHEHDHADVPSWGWRPWAVVGNVSTTTLVGLEADTGYEWRVSAISEDQYHSDEWRADLDLYGRRAMLPGALVGPPSPPTNLTTTLRVDLRFGHFDANSTLNSSAIDARATLGPSGVWGGEGHYGLALVGSAQIEGCNASVSCCDKYRRWERRQDKDDGDSDLCLPRSMSCFVRGGSTLVDQIGGRRNGTPTGDTLTVDPLGAGDANADGHAPVDVRLPTNIRAAAADPGVEGGAGQGQTVVTNHSTFSHRPTEPCGPALRLTPSLARSSAAAWYPRKLNVREGFESEWVFRVANPSTECSLMDDEYTHCRARGADGFAFVIHNAADGGTHTLGEGGMGLGYSGILNSLAVEFDSWYNAELLEPYENHLAVHTRGWRHPNSANHSFALGSTPAIPDITDGVHRVRVVYDPRAQALERAAESNPAAFAPSTHAAYFLSNADYPQGGQADWGTGVGVLSVYVDDMHRPALVIPLNLCATIDCDTGRAWVGFTAATGDRFWQVHDVLEWQLRSLRLDPHYEPPPIVNGEGAHACNDPRLCVHR